VTPPLDFNLENDRDQIDTDKAQKGAVVITGAGRGIGQEIAKKLAVAHFPLVLISKSAELLKKTHNMCKSTIPVQSIVIDVRKEEEVCKLSSLLNNFPSLHAVVNNAGVGHWSPIEETSIDNWNNQIDTNLRGAFLTIRETLPHFRRQGHGIYINVGSDCSLIGMPHRAAYNSSKFGLVGLTVSLRAEVESEGVHACMVYAGKADTYFRDHQPGDRPGALDASDVAEVIAFVIKNYPRIVVGEVSVFPPKGGLSGVRSFI